MNCDRHGCPRPNSHWSHMQCTDADRHRSHVYHPEHTIYGPYWCDGIDSERGRDVSSELTEVRTVHSRALSAIDRLDCLKGNLEKHGPSYYHQELDREFDEMREALTEAVDALARWQKTGRPKR